MTLELKTRHRKSLAALQYECAYQDDLNGDASSYVLWEQLLGSAGAKTRSDLVDAGYAVAGPHRWSAATGYRITEAGKAALAAEPAPKPKPPRRKLKSLPPLLRSAN